MKYTKVEGSLKFSGGDSDVNVSFLGTKVPDQQRDIPDYIASLVAKTLTGLNDNEVDELKQRNMELQKKVDALIAEKKDAQSVKAPKSSRLGRG